MKKFFYLLIGVMLLTASCSNDSETDFFTEVAKNEQAMNDKTSGKNASTINSDAINTYAKLEQSNQSRRN